MAGNPEPKGQASGAGDADAGAGGDPEIAWSVRRADDERSRREVGAVVGQRDAEGAGDVAGPGRHPGRVGGDAAPPGHRPPPGERLQRADQHTARPARAPGDGVQAEVHPVSPEHVGVPALAVEQRVARRAEGRVGGGVLGTQIGFGLHDPPGRHHAVAATQEDAAEEVAGDLAGGAEVEGSGQRHGAADATRGPGAPRRGA